MGLPPKFTCVGSCHNFREQVFSQLYSVSESVSIDLDMPETFPAKTAHRVDAIYTGHIIYTPSTFLDLIPDRYKQKPISLYEPREAPLLNQYRLIVPRTRNILEVMQFIILLVLYLAFMAERDPEILSPLEVAFSIYAFGWVLDQFATILEHGW